LDTNRCIIRDLKQDDYDDVKTLYFNNKVREFLGGVISLERYNSIFKEMINITDDSLYWVVRLKNTNDFIGLVSIDIHHDGINKELSYQFLPSYWGNGYALEVIKEILSFISNELNIKKIVSETQVANNASCLLLNKVGMEIIDKVYRFNSEQYIFSWESM
jgi:ribosomal-protein-alanine N-acetyltransferase